MQNCKITEKRVLYKDIFLMNVLCPKIAIKRKAGQFIILKINEQGERIPLTITDSDPETGTVTLIFQVVGKTTQQLSSLNTGDAIQDFVGPLGKPTHIENFGNAVCIGGGIGTAPILPIAKSLKENGNRVLGILGARSRELLILENEMKELCNELLITTDDGSYGIKGFVTTALEQLYEKNKQLDVVFAIGPVPMMKATCSLTKKLNIRTYVSLNSMMVDGTGMCGGCRVTIDGKSKFVCVDGPEFDGHLVNFDELSNRLAFYRDQEAESHKLFKTNCKLEGAL
ncbi:MAG: sulfide/dihydroorotate dehydrogenase-like FAD/NAD-binding protein [bacterium]